MLHVRGDNGALGVNRDLASASAKLRSIAMLASFSISTHRVPQQVFANGARTATACWPTVAATIPSGSSGDLSPLRRQVLQQLSPFAPRKGGIVDAPHDVLCIDRETLLASKESR